MATIQIASFGRLLTGTVEPSREYLELNAGTSAYPNPPYPNATAASLPFLPMKIDTGTGRLIPMTANENARCVGFTRNGLSFATTGNARTCQVTLALKDCVFQANLKSGQSIAQVDQLVAYGFDIVDPGAGTRMFVVDKAQTGAAARLIIVDFIDPVGEAQGRVAFVFLDANLALNQ
jgi:hypothetical protein